MPVFVQRSVKRKTRKTRKNGNKRGQGALARWSYEFERQRRILLGSETWLESVRSSGPLRVALVYPNTYHVGMSNLGVQAVMKMMSLSGCLCERAFLPMDYDFSGHPQPALEEGLLAEPVRTLESGSPLSHFDVVAFSIPFELDYINVLRILDSCGITLKAKERNPREPLIIGGGSALTLNPEPVADFFDAIVIGDGEPVIESMVERLTEHCPKQDREAVWEALSQIRGVYTPQLPQQVDARLSRAFAPKKELRPVSSVVLTPHTEFSGMFLVEVGRGCPHTCRFCTVGYAERPARFFPSGAVWEAIEPHLERVRKVGLLGAVVSDHPKIEELAWRIVNSGKQLTAASLRMDTLSEDLIAALAKGGSKTLTVAPESGTERLRNVIGKPIKGEKIFEFVGYAAKHGIETVKLYFMIGLPFETDEDVQGIADLTQRLSATYTDLRFQLSASVFIPKPHTPFQWFGLCPPEEVERKRRMLQKSLRSHPRIAIDFESVRWAQVQSLLATGGRETAEVALRAHRLGSMFSAWRSAVRDVLGRDLTEVVTQRRHLEGIYPWMRVESGAPMTMLKEELLASMSF